MKNRLTPLCAITVISMGLNLFSANTSSARQPLNTDAFTSDVAVHNLDTSSIPILPTVMVRARAEIPVLPVVMVSPTEEEIAAAVATQTASINETSSPSQATQRAMSSRIRFDMPYYSFGKMLPHIGK